jgi:hypothetical protein
MDGKQFDLIARGLARKAPRRRLLGGLLGAAVAALGGGSVSAVYRRKRKGHDGKDGDETESDLPPGTLTGGIWDETIDMCHFDPEAGAYKVVAIPTTSVPDYLGQGDTLYIDCCESAECGVLPCLSPAGCIEGACMYDPVPGEFCALGDGTTGVCDDEGVCVVGVTGETSAPSY